MNVVRFNDPFVEALATKPVTLERDLMESWQTAPLFDVQLPESVAVESADAVMLSWVDDKSQDQLPEVIREPWPFPCLRASLTLKPDNHESRHPIWMTEIKAMSGVHLIAGQTDDGAVVLFHAMNSKGLGRDEPMFLFHLSPDGSMSFDAVYVRRYGWLPPNRWYLIMNAGGEPVSIDHFRKMTGRVIASVLIVFAAFLASAMSPQNHMVTVTPNQPHRSIQWLQARTHYTLITHGHPANRPTIQHGERVQSDEQGELTRMAHNRRAHYRTLRSERFRYARGKRIFVRATWVGPKEWKDAGGKQIYHILEPVTADKETLEVTT